MSEELSRLQEENRRLRKLLNDRRIELPPELAAPVQQPVAAAAPKLTNDAKVRLFRELFRAREDVYAVRWESPDGRKGYAPKSERNWEAYRRAAPQDRQQAVKDCVAEYGHIVVDECHHLSAFTFEKVMKEVKARYVVGLTATPARKDGHHPIIFMQCGPIRYRMKARAMTDATPFEHVVVPRPTDFRAPAEQTEITIQQVYAALVNDQARNDMIASDLIQAVQCGRNPLLLTGRTEHLAQFQEKLTGSVRNVFVLRGGLGRKQRNEIAEQMALVSENEQRVILATGSYIGEGFDDPRLDTLFLAMPISWHGTLQQYVGRLHRLHDSKRVVEVYDYVDPNVRMLARMYDRRLKGYADMGYRILDSGTRQKALSLEFRV